MPAIGPLSLGGVPRVALAVGKPEDPGLQGLRAQGVDLLEARLDLWPADPGLVSASLARLKALGLPLLLTCRLSSEGGRWEGDEGARMQLLLGNLKFADAVDLELQAAGSVAEAAREAQGTGKTLIVSSHNMKATPKDAEMEARFDAAKGLGAHIVKVACLALDGNDLLRLLNLVWRRRQDGVIGISMGPEGALSRVVAPRFGSLLTYTGQERAYGQLPLDELVAALKALYPEFRAEHKA